MFKYKHFLSKLGRTVPVVQAPMANVSTEKLASAVHNSGGLGSLALSPINLIENSDSVFEQISRFRSSCSKQALVNCNFFCFDPSSQPEPTNHEFENWVSLYEKATQMTREEILQKVGSKTRAVVSFKEFEENHPEKFQRFVDQLIEAKVGVVSFHFGIPSQSTIEKLQAGGIMVWGCVTSVEEAGQLVELGVDALVCQGYEAGGHRGNFLTDSASDENLGTLALFRQIKAFVDTLSCAPLLIPSGGITDGATVMSYLSEGAAAVQLGTIFIPTVESSAPKFIANVIKGGNRIPTVMTSLISGRNARTLRTPFIEALIKEQASQKYDLPSFGYSTSAYKQFSNGLEKYGFYLAGQNYHLVEPGKPAKIVMEKLASEIKATSPNDS